MKDIYRLGRHYCSVLASNIKTSSRSKEIFKIKINKFLKLPGQKEKIHVSTILYTHDFVSFIAYSRMPHVRCKRKINVYSREFSASRQIGPYLSRAEPAWIISCWSNRHVFTVLLIRLSLVGYWNLRNLRAWRVTKRKSREETWAGKGFELGSLDETRLCRTDKNCLSLDISF